MALDQLDQPFLEGIAQVLNSVDVDDFFKDVATRNLCTLKDHFVGRADGGGRTSDAGQGQFAELAPAQGTHSEMERLEYLADTGLFGHHDMKRRVVQDEASRLFVN